MTKTRRLPSNPVGTTSRFEEISALAVLVLAALVTFYVRLRLLSVPLERDEGEYAYLAQLMLQGRPPFLDAYSMKLPGTPLAYAVFMSIFGQTTESVHLALLAANALTACFLWLVTRRLFDSRTASASTAIFLLLALSSGVMGAFAHATQFVNLFTLAGFGLILVYEERGRKSLALAAGLCFGFAILMKQHAAVLALFAACFVAWIARSQAKRWSSAIWSCALFAAASTIPLALIVLWTVQAGTFGKLWFWTFSYALEYAHGIPLPYAKGSPFLVGLSVLRSQLMNLASLALPVWILAMLGIPVLFIARREHTTSQIFVFGLLISSFLAICPGFYFREHYFVLLLPPVAILAGLALTDGVRLAARKWPPAWGGTVSAAVLAAVLCQGYWAEHAYLFQRTPTEVSRALYSPNPFPESPVIAAYVAANSAADDRIAVLGSEPQLFFYSKRKSATGHIYIYGLMEDQPYADIMQQEMIAEIQAARPLYLVFVRVNYSWGFDDKSPKRIFRWVDEYVSANYGLSGVVDIGSHDSRYVWGEDAKAYRPMSENFVTVWRRRATPPSERSSN